MPDWKREAGRQLDRLIVAEVPGVRKAVRWDTPFYGGAQGGWFLGFHCVPARRTAEPSTWRAGTDHAAPPAIGELSPGS